MSNAGGVGSTLNRYSDMLAGNAAYVPNSYYSIATLSNGAGTGEFVFTSIPQTYTHLQLRILARGTTSATTDYSYVRFNSDVGTNYAGHGLFGDGSSVTANSNGNTSYSLTGIVSAATAGANMYGTIIVDILDYTNTNKYKTIRALSGTDQNGSGQVRLESGLWMSTAAISSIYVGGYLNVFAAGSTAALYGIK
jgi:hypothetical protein